MNLKQKHTRLEILFIVLKYDSRQILRHFSVSDRIFINQERGNIMANETAIYFYDKPINDKPYLQKQSLENKIDFVIEKVQNNEKIYNEILQEI